jgi:hypothetical protein
MLPVFPDFRLISTYYIADEILDSLLTKWSTISIIVELSIAMFICISWLYQILISVDGHVSSHNVVSCTHRLSRIRTHKVAVICIALLTMNGLVV